MDNSTNNKITKFTDLEAWKFGHELVLLIYDITSRYPKAEMFGLVMQSRRAVVSITSNITEGFSRQSYKEKTQFYFMAKGSLAELHDQLLIAQDLGFVTKKKFDEVSILLEREYRILCGLIKSSQSKGGNYNE